jgi:hypothetical protein
MLVAWSNEERRQIASGLLSARHQHDRLSLRNAGAR